VSESILTLPPPPYDRRIRYGDAPQHFADVRFPHSNSSTRGTRETHRPAIINIHGGYWRAKYDLAHAGHFCAALTNAGCVTVNLEYRRVGDPGGGWPGTFEDLRRAFSYIQQHADELRIDPAHITVTGHSAGGQLALCLTAHEPRIARVVSLAGVLDLHRAWELHLSNDAVVEFLGGTPQQVPEHYREASPMNLAIASAEQIIVVGTNDEDAPIELSRKYASTKKQRGENARYVEIAGADHFDMIDPRSKFWATISGAIKGS
jgi:acetyl esterase/lipase